MELKCQKRALDIPKYYFYFIMVAPCLGRKIKKKKKKVAKFYTMFISTVRTLVWLFSGDAANLVKI